MGWEQRGKRRYYYRTRRVLGRVVRQYLGHGPEAEAAAAEDARKQQRRLLVRGWLRDIAEMRLLGRMRLKVIRIARTALAQHAQDIAAGLVPDDQPLSAEQCRVLRAEVNWQPPVDERLGSLMVPGKNLATFAAMRNCCKHRASFAWPVPTDERPRSDQPSGFANTIVDPLRPRATLPRGPPWRSSMANFRRHGARSAADTPVARQPRDFGMAASPHTPHVVLPNRNAPQRACVALGTFKTEHALATRTWISNPRSNASRVAWAKQALPVTMPSSVVTQTRQPRRA